MPLHILFDFHFLEAAQKYDPRNLEQMTPALCFHSRQERMCTKKKKRICFDIQNIASKKSEQHTCRITFWAQSFCTFSQYRQADVRTRDVRRPSALHASETPRMCRRENK